MERQRAHDGQMEGQVNQMRGMERLSGDGEAVWGWSTDLSMTWRGSTAAATMIARCRHGPSIEPGWLPAESHASKPCPWSERRAQLPSTNQSINETWVQLQSTSQPTSQPMNQQLATLCTELLNAKVAIDTDHFPALHLLRT